MTPVKTWAMDINTDRNWSRTTDLDMAFNNSPSLGVTMALVAEQATQISLALVAAWHLYTNMVSGDQTQAFFSP